MLHPMVPISQGSGEQQKGEVKQNPQDAGEGRPQEVSWWQVEGGQVQLRQVKGSRRGYFMLKLTDHLVCWDTSGRAWPIGRVQC